MTTILNKINRAFYATTMHRIVLYALSVLAGYAILLSFFKILPYSGFFLVLSLTLLVFVCYGTNQVLSFFIKIPAHAESAIITGLILFFLFLPITTVSDALSLAFAGVIAIASKYIFTFKGKKIFNPVAFSAVVLGVFGNGAMWWIGSPVMFPAVIIVAFCIIKKTRRFDLFLITVAASFISVITLNIMSSESILNTLLQHLLSWPIIFFASVMVTEPLTLPQTKKLQLVYGAGIGILSSIPFHIGSLYSSPELALIAGNIFSYAANMRRRLFLQSRHTEKFL